VDDIKFVINYDYPNCSEDYVHRIGRTGRRDKHGTAYTFFTSTNFKQAHELIDVLREANQTINPELFAMAHRSGRGVNANNRRRRWGYAASHNGNGNNMKRKYEDRDFGSELNDRGNKVTRFT